MFLATFSLDLSLLYESSTGLLTVTEASWSIYMPKTCNYISFLKASENAFKLAVCLRLDPFLLLYAKSFKLNPPFFALEDVPRP